MAGTVRKITDHLFRSVDPGGERLAGSSASSSSYAGRRGCPPAWCAPGGSRRTPRSCAGGVDRCGRVRGAPWAARTARPWASPSGAESPELWCGRRAYWSEVRPMVLQSADEVAPVVHVPYSPNEGSAFWEQANATYQAGLALTQSQRETAMFWRDNPHSSGLPVRPLDADRPPGVPAAATLPCALGRGLCPRRCGAPRCVLELLDLEVPVQPDPSRGLRPPTTSIPTGSPGSTRPRSRSTPPDIRWPRPRRPTGSPTSSASSRSPTPTRSRSGAPASSAPSERRPRQAATSRLYGGIHYPMAIAAGLRQGDAIGALVVDRLQTRR